MNDEVDRRTLFDVALGLIREQDDDLVAMGRALMGALEGAKFCRYTGDGWHIIGESNKLYR